MKPNLHSKITAETSLQANLTPTGQLTTERPAPSSSSRLTLDAATPPHYLHWPSPTQFVLSPAKQAHGPVSSAPAGAPCVKDAFGMSAGNKPLPTSAFASSGKFDAFPVEGVTRLHSLKAASPFTGAVASLGHPSTLHSSGGRSVASSESRLGKYFLLTRPTAPAEGAFGGLTRPGSGARYAGHDVCSELCLSGTLTEKLNRRTSQHEALVERVWGGGSVRGADVRHAHHDAGSFRTVRCVRESLVNRLITLNRISCPRQRGVVAKQLQTKMFWIVALDHASRLLNHTLGMHGERRE